MKKTSVHIVRDDIVHDRNVHDRNEDTVRQLCRDIHNRADDRERLQTLVIQLQAALVRGNETRAGKFTPQRDNPFDKIMAG
jgi:hypothetical protein